MDRAFNECYRCYSVAMHSRSNSLEMEKGDKIVLPQSAFNKLARMNIQYPMLFCLSNSRNSNQNTLELEFSAEEGKCCAALDDAKSVAGRGGSLKSTT